MTLPLRPNVTRVGQPYVDEAVTEYHFPRADLVSPVAMAICSDVPKPLPYISHYARVKLRWMKPDGQGGFVPRRK